MSNALTQESRSLFVSRIQDPIAAMETLGRVIHKAGACGVQTQEQGQLVAMACMMENMTPFELAKTYHLIDGKLSMRSDAMLARFREIGGEYKWINTGEDGVEAKAEFSYRGNKGLIIAFSMKNAEQAGLIKSGSNWGKDPGPMLRARVISRAVRMLAPEVCMGAYTPEELGDSSAGNSPVGTIDNVSSAPSNSKPAAAEAVVEAEVETNEATKPAPESVPQKESKKSAEKAVKAPKIAPFDAEEASQDAPTAETKDTPAGDTEIIELERLLKLANIEIAAFEHMLRSRDKEFVSLEALSSEKVLQISENLRKRLRDAGVNP